MSEISKRILREYKPKKPYKLEVKATPHIEFQDITAPDIVEIQIRDDRKVIWVNVNGICALRICQIKHLEIQDASK